jgi:hypothetical protein
MLLPKHATKRTGTFMFLTLILTLLVIIITNMGLSLAQQEQEMPSQGDIDEAIKWLESPSGGEFIVMKTEKITDPASENYRYGLVVYSYREQYTSYTPETPEGIGISVFEATIYDQKEDGRFRPGTTVFQEGAISSVPLTYISLDDLDKELALAEEAVRDYMDEWGLLSGWQEIKPPEDVPDEEYIPPEPEGEETEHGDITEEGPDEEETSADTLTNQPPGGIREIGDIPGPDSWPQAATGILFPGFLGLLIALLTNLSRGGVPPVGTLPAGPPAPPEPQPPAAPPLDDLSLYARKWITNQKGYSHYHMDPAYRELIDRMERECFGPDGRVDWELYCDYEFGPVEEMKKAYNVKEDTLVLHAKEFAKATKASAVGTVVAVKDGVVGFTKGIIAIPGAIFQGYKELGNLFLEGCMDTARDFWNPNPLERRSGLLDDLMNPDVIMQTGENLYETVGKELLPIEEIKCFFEGDATLEEKLCAIPSIAAKIANVIMMSPKIATMPVRGIPKDLTLLRSAKPVNRAIEAAKASVSAEVQAEYEAYKAAAAEKASGITKTVEEGGALTKEQVLDAMRDPATMRQLKQAPGTTQSKFFATQAREVYSPVYRDVIGYMEGKNPGVEFRMKSVRTPGQKNLINTDNDLILQRKVTTPEGKTYWEEVPTRKWQGRYNESFSEHTGFSLDEARARFPEENWDTMSPQQQQKVWTEKFGQETMDVKQAEAAHAFSDQPTAMRPDWEPGAKSPVSEGKMVDQEGLGLMERYKTTKGWQEGTVSTQTKSMEQGAKAGDLSKRLAPQSQVRTGYQYSYPKIFEQGLDIVKMRDLAPAVRDIALKNLGFRGGYAEFMDKLSSWMGGLG